MPKIEKCEHLFMPKFYTTDGNRYVVGEDETIESEEGIVVYKCEECGMEVWQNGRQVDII